MFFIWHARIDLHLEFCRMLRSEVGVLNFWEILVALGKKTPIGGKYGGIDF